MDIIQIDKTNIDTEHICCAIGNDKENKLRADSKKKWLKEQFDKGLLFKRLDARGKVFIEYMPIESVWKPVIGRNCYVINCLWVSGQYKGKRYATELLNECIADAEKNKLNGIAVVSSNKVKPFLTDKKFFVKHGFEVVDTAAPYFELLYLRIKNTKDLPQFMPTAKNGTCSNKAGFTFIYSNQCVFMEEYVALLSRIARDEGHECTIIKLKTAEEAQKKGSPFGTLGIYYKGVFLTHELMTEEKFRKLIQDTCV